MKNKKYLIAEAIVLAITVAVIGSFFSQKHIAEAVPTSVASLKNNDVYTLTASTVKKTIAGKEQTMLAYNGSIPGPTIQVPQGSTITIDFRNQTNETQLLHSHGVRMDNAYDGSQLVQKEIQPGGSFQYKLTFPDPGVYWYHPHVNEVLDQALGLYGAFVVIPKDANYFPPTNDQQVLFLSDITVNNAGAIAFNPSDHALMGHYGNVMLVNGSDNYSLPATAGEVLQLSVINAANARPFNFAIQGAKLKLVGGDNGAYEKAQYVDSVVLAPSERAILDVYFPTAGTFAMQNKTPDNVATVGKVIVTGTTVTPSYVSTFNQLQTNTSVTASIDPFRSYFAKAPDKRLTLTLAGMMNMGGGMMGSTSSDGIEWNDTGMMSGMTTDTTKWEIVDKDTGKINMGINWQLQKDKPVKIEIYNSPSAMHAMQHPIHFHGQRFLVLSRNGVPEKDLVWKDTVMVPVGQAVDILLDPTNPGVWMAHCHISEHLASGMMFSYTVN